MLSECQTAWIWVSCRVILRLIQIQAVCIWNLSRAWRLRVKKVFLQRKQLKQQQGQSNCQRKMLNASPPFSTWTILLILLNEYLICKHLDN